MKLWVLNKISVYKFLKTYFKTRFHNFKFVFLLNTQLSNVVRKAYALYGVQQQFLFIKKKKKLKKETKRKKIN